ncbi:3-deoxy-D-manno-octulosonic acid transferase [Pseudooceanicola spongiae]|uniref:3-deoxy-D-manno-octulosonic acid transferase n=1 Tax=Pseudooceanicola spongiae TaxID=2613965 RepID=A0A7L9WSW8_9RHOB|nr:glycosyltransferase N-terminal domain-containing protein [Pseudooceanicola spongiae]QOL82200.1 3-deoxy-D-manno-octulosonic acid transferase [Pseudooceanicola spongiae]
MGRAAGFAAYKALTRRAARPQTAGAVPARPRGVLIWIHCPLAARQKAAEQLASRLIAQDEGYTILLTFTEGGTQPPLDEPGLIYGDLPEDDSAAVTAFLDHWRPDLLIWLTGYLRPVLLHQARRQNLAMLLAEAEEDAFDEPRWGLRVGQSRRLLVGFHTVLASSANTARKLQRHGVEQALIEITGPLQEGGCALPCDDALRDDLAAGLAGRPIWLAAMVQLDELETVLDAHRRASRLAHRLLLVLVPARAEDAEVMAETLSREGWRALRWSEDEAPREETQILLTDSPEEMGLWYRLSPITFMAGSLKRGMKGHDPYAPAALGSAIVYGPFVSRHIAAYTRLAQAGAARIVRDSDGLQKALSRLIAPDQAATMAAAAWQVATDGAEATDRVVDWIRAELDMAGKR